MPLKTEDQERRRRRGMEKRGKAETTSVGPSVVLPLLFVPGREDAAAVDQKATADAKGLLFLEEAKEEAERHLSLGGPEGGSV